MATFTESEVTDLAEILATNSEELGYRLDIYAEVITDSDKTKAVSLVSEWQDITAYESVEARDRNFGVNYNPAAHRRQLASRIASLIHCTDMLNSSGGSRLVRA